MARYGELGRRLNIKQLGIWEITVNAQKPNLSFLNSQRKTQSMKGYQSFNKNKIRRKRDFLSPSSENNLTYMAFYDNIMGKFPDYSFTKI